MVSALISRFIVMTVGTLYPAYRSYKAVRTKDVREYVKWMMYWITFAVYLTLEMFTDTFVSFWLPFYYELKIIFVIWLISPYTKGASLLYRKFIHPLLTRHEDDIDQYLDKAKSESYTTLLRLGNQGIVYARDVVATAAVKGVSHIHRSYSLNDVSSDEGGAEYRRVAVKQRAGVEITEILEEEGEDHPDHQDHQGKGRKKRESKKAKKAEENEEERVWQGYYDNSGQLVEEEFEELGDGDYNPPRRSGRKKQPGGGQGVPGALKGEGAATLPRTSSRNRRAKNS